MNGGRAGVGVDVDVEDDIGEDGGEAEDALSGTVGEDGEPDARD